MDKFTFTTEREASTTQSPGDVWLSELLQHSEMRSVPIKPQNSELPPQRVERTDDQKIEEVAANLASQLTAKASTMKGCTSNQCEQAQLNMFNPKALPHGIVAVQLDFELERERKTGLTNDEIKLAEIEPNRLQEDLLRTLNQLISSGADDAKFKTRLKIEDKNTANGVPRALDGKVHVHLLRGLN